MKTFDGAGWLPAVVGLFAAGAALAGPMPDDGFDWATIGAPGNRATLPHEVPYQPELSVGAVPYEYRITRTEVTVGQWFEFVQAYAPYWEGSPTHPNFVGNWIEPVGADPLVYEIVPGAENRPTTMSWRMAARYCNWLHNGKIGERWAFESGAYDTSTFTENPDGSFNDQPAHTPGARYWIPTLDEWVKAAYYDPDRHGSGRGGYWLFPNASDVALVSGYPDAGGETNAGEFPYDDIRFLDVGSYPHVRSPWGLLDVSGGVSEWLEDSSGWARFEGGTRQFQPFHELFDRVDSMMYWGSVPWSGGKGIRLATSVPAPSGGTLFMCVVLFCARRRR